MEHLVSSAGSLSLFPVFSTVLLAIFSCRMVLVFDKMVLCPGISHFLHHRSPGGAKSAQTYQSPEPIISIPGYLSTCYSLNFGRILYRQNFVIKPYTGSLFFPQ